MAPAGLARTNALVVLVTVWNARTMVGKEGKRMRRGLYGVGVSSDLEVGRGGRL